MASTRIATKSPVIVQISGATPTAAVIWCHGLGDTPHGWASFCQDICRSLGGYVKFILPYAPDQPVTCNGGMVMPSWMDLVEIPIHITSPDNGAQQDDSISYLQSLVDEVVASGIPSERVVLGGFSQGGALALASTISSNVKLGGCCSLSGWALPKQQLQENLEQSASFTSPFLICHGEADQVVTSPNGPHVAKLLSDGGATVTLKTYPGLPHSMCPEEQDDVLDFLIKHIPEEA